MPLIKYYIELEDDKGYPFAAEIARGLYDKVGLTSPNYHNRPADTLVRAALDTNELRHEAPKMFYNTRSGLRRVYPHAGETVLWLIAKIEENTGIIKIAGKKYRYARKEK